ncbi:MAG: hypothetical protein IJ561_02345 [Ruminococcus sp.]|nr:hypothetical protein [Ruminococcus sp.]
MTRSQKQLVRAFILEMAFILIAAKIKGLVGEPAGGTIAMLVWLLAVSLHGMYIYYDYRREQAYKAERRKVKEFAGALSSAYERNDKK